MKYNIKYFVLLNNQEYLLFTKYHELIGHNFGKGSIRPKLYETKHYDGLFFEKKILYTPLTKKLYNIKEPDE